MVLVPASGCGPVPAAPERQVVLLDLGRSTIQRVSARLALGAVALALSVAACSGDDRVLESGSPPTPPGAAATSRGEPASAANERFCAGVRATNEQLRQAKASGTVQAAEDRFSSAAKATRGMVEVTPDRLKADAETVAQAYVTYVDELRKAGWIVSRLPAGTTEKLGAPDVKAAGGRLEVYQRQVCGTVD